MANLEKAPPPVVETNDTQGSAGTEVPLTPAAGAATAPDIAASRRQEEQRILESAGTKTGAATVSDKGFVFAATGGGEGSDNPAQALVSAALKKAEEMNSVGYSARAVREALKATGQEFTPMNAADLGQQMFDSGKYEKIPFDPSKAQPGDVLVRPWTQKNIADHGGKTYGDIMVITGRNDAGGLTGANDHITNNITPDGQRYEGSYLLRLKPKS